MMMAGGERTGSWWVKPLSVELPQCVGTRRPLARIGRPQPFV